MWVADSARLNAYCSGVVSLGVIFEGGMIVCRRLWKSAAEETRIDVRAQLSFTAIGGIPLSLLWASVAMGLILNTLKQKKCCQKDPTSVDRCWRYVSFILKAVSTFDDENIILTLHQVRNVRTA